VSTISAHGRSRPLWRPCLLSFLRLVGRIADLLLEAGTADLDRLLDARLGLGRLLDALRNLGGGGRATRHREGTSRLHCHARRRVRASLLASCLCVQRDLRDAV
jgi:hypothetical protein